MPPAAAVARQSPVLRLGPLFFDPRGVDFTAWVNSFKDNVYRESEQLRAGAYGRVEVEFVVQADGTIRESRIYESSGVGELDQLAQRAILRACCPPLPEAFPEQQSMMRVLFDWRERLP